MISSSRAPISAAASAGRTPLARFCMRAVHRARLAWMRFFRACLNAAVRKPTPAGYRRGALVLRPKK